VLFELPEIDDVGRAHDRAVAAGLPITTSLGRHRNDGMFSFYVKSPVGFDIEVGCHGLLVDENWTPNRFVEGDVWGPQGSHAGSAGAGRPQVARPAPSSGRSHPLGERLEAEPA
jgi:3,4-dihydroxy-9,10-secoandrosta-1,3,5(10)-triene-9,17-dione 4,5-dioxygenase